uniref:Myosin XVB n=1 Tax=Sarcophilus harrisii TaxID=9305 RepID=A0A7N4V5Q2_SARHA
QELGRLEIPAELLALLKIAEGRQHVMAENITEALPPEITAQESLALPPDINRFPFSRFIPENFEKPILPSPGKPLTSPLTNLDGANLQLALDINKVMLRLLGDLSLQSWQEQTMGTYLAQQGLRHPTLRNEIFCQLVTQLWHNPDEQQCHRGWALMAILLSAFTPTLILQKPLLKFVSDHAPKGIAAVCQHKLLGALQRPQAAINTVRAYPPTQLEWISGWRCGRMALDVFTFSEECYSAEVKSWTTGEEFAGWILQSRGIEQPIRGWSVSLLSEDSWQDLVGCDFVLDLIGHTEDLGDSSAPHTVLLALGNCSPDTRWGLWQIHILNDSPSPHPVYPGMTQIPSYQPAMGAMMPAPAPFVSAMPPVPSVGGVPIMPAMMLPSQAQPVVPTLSTTELASQQQNFINQQAMILAQQMTTQAMTLSLEQQAQQQRLARASTSDPPTAPSKPKKQTQPLSCSQQVETPEEVKEKLKHPRTFQQKRDYFQKIGKRPQTKAMVLQAEITSPKAEDKARTGSSPEAKSQKESREKHQGTVVRSSKPAVKRAEPSREIRNIIKMYQSRPAPVPEPIQPIRRPQRSFIKKNDPKDEALAKLGLSGNQLPPLPSALGPKKGSPPPVSPRPLKSSSSIKEKQRPLMNLFAPTQSTTSIPEPSPPPPPPLPPSENLVSPSSGEETPIDPSESFSNMGDEHISTQLLHLSSSVSFAYASATWRLFLRKEVGKRWILRDTFTESCIRISPDERSKMKDMLADLQVGMDASSIVEDSIKKRIVVAARDNWANYFSRIFNVSAESGSDVQFLAVSHRGLRLLKSVNNATFLADHLKTLCSYSFAEVLEVETPGNNILQLTLKNEQLILHTTQAQAIKSMVELFLSELKKDSSYVIALRSYVTDDRSLLSFRHGDIIKLLPMASLEPGWQFGSIGGRSGLFPSDMVTVAAVPDYLTFSKEQKDGWQRSLSKAEPGSSPQNRAMEALRCPQCTPLTFFSHFCSTAVMQFMGDQPKKKDELDIIFEMLKLCKENKLKDEIYCQLIKQVTENPQQESCIQGWNLLSLLTGYFLPSSTLMPYVIKFLQDAAPGQELVQKCQEHLQRTVKYGGRQYLPSFGEIQAFLKGQISRPLLLHLPGGTEYKTVIQTFTVVREVLEEMCIQMGIRELLEVQEFAIFLIKGQGALVRPLHPNKYLNDVVRESGVELHSRRLTWDSPLHYENEVYISTHYSQVSPSLVSSDLLRYIPEALHRQVNLRILGTLVESQLKASKRYSRREAQIGFIEAMRNLPLFGYTIYIVLRVSEPRIATPCLLGLNHHRLVLVNPSSQEQCHSITLKEIQKLRQLSALNDVPGLELNYGSSANPKTIWFELPQAQELLHTLNFLMENSTST